MNKSDVTAYLEGMIEQLNRYESRGVEQDIASQNYWAGYRKAAETVLAWAKEHKEHDDA